MCVCEWVNVWGSLSAYLGGELLEELVEYDLLFHVLQSLGMGGRGRTGG